MSRRLSSYVSPNPDINEDRGNALELIKIWKKEPHVATKKDIRWFWEDMDMDDVESEIVWAYVTPKVDKLSQMYPFRVTEWFENFYRFMPDILPLGLDGTGQIDWNLFFSLAYPLPGGLAVPFRSMVRKLNVAQLRLVKEKIINEIWEDKDLRKKIINWDLIPSIYIHYMPYQLIRKRVVEKDKKMQKNIRKEAVRDLEARSYGTLRELFNQVEQAKKEGKEVVYQ